MITQKQVIEKLVRKLLQSEKISADGAEFKTFELMKDLVHKLVEVIVIILPYTREEGLLMDIDELSEEIVSNFNALFSDIAGLKLTLEVLRKPAVKRLYYYRIGGLLNTLPQQIRDVYSIEMNNLFTEAGAEIEEICYKGFEFAPKIIWWYQGEKYAANFLLDGSFYEGVNWDMTDPYDHTVESIVRVVAPKLAKGKYNE